MLERIDLVSRSSAHEAILHHAQQYEHRFGIAFEAFTCFPAELLETLKSASPDLNLRSPDHLILSGHNYSALDEMSDIANKKKVTDSDRHRYLQIFLDVYRDLPFDPSPADGSLTITPRREGMLLARELGWLADSVYSSHLKRIPFQGGLVVGIEKLRPALDRTRRCRIVDGAIASGATVITLMEMFSDLVERFEIYTIHCGAESLNALLSYADLLRKDIAFYVGFVSGVLNKKFYVVSVESPSALIVGDVGDMIAPILDQK